MAVTIISRARLAEILTEAIIEYGASKEEEIEDFLPAFLDQFIVEFPEIEFEEDQDDDDCDELDSDALFGSEGEDDDD